MTNQQAVNIRRAALLLSFAAVFLKADAGNDTLQVPDNVNCSCPGEVLTFTCNINGGGTTLWGGSAFDCSSTSNEIRLRHSQFASPGTSGTCNNNAMRARSVGVVNTECYISELSVTVSSAFNNSMIRCNHDSGTGERSIGSFTLTVVSVLDSPSGIRFINLHGGQITLSWTSVESTTCVPVNYRVTSNCSTCNSSTTNLTTDSCSLPQQWTDGLVCAFSVRSVVCGGNLMGRLSNPAIVTLQEPRVTIIPRYSGNGNSLTKFIVLGTNLRIARSNNNMNTFITTYNVIFSNPDTGNVIYSAPFPTCRKDTCETDITPPSLSQVCPSSIITIAAENELGQRLLSNPIEIGCQNQFVDVRYNSADSTISCMFNQTDTSIKSCRVMYGPCGQEQTQVIQRNSSSALPNDVMLSIMPHGSYCYTVTASSGNFSVAVEGMIQSESGGANVGAVIGGAVGASVIIIILVLVSVIVIIMIKVNCRKGLHDGTLQLNIIVPIEVKLKLEPLVGRNFVKIDIEKDCTLREAIEYHPKKLKFKRGHAYYEFFHEKENVSEDKELIFINKNTGKCLSPNVPVSVLYENNLLGVGVQKPEYKNYQVFVQSTGSGARHLPAGSVLLYEKVQTKEWNPDKPPLQQVISNHFMTTTISNECTMEEFQQRNDLRLKGANVFIEYGDPVMKDIRDVILKHKKTGKLFTGPTARSSPSTYLENYRVFVLPRETEKLKLEPGITVLHQNPESRMNLQFRVLEVDEDNVQMAKFVEQKINKVKFENGKAFYEFTQMEEDFLFYRDVVLMPKSLDVKQKQNEPEFISSVRRFYWLSSSVPGIGIQPQMFFKGNRVFVQSTSQGSRCLKARSLLLYKV